MPRAAASRKEAAQHSTRQARTLSPRSSVPRKRPYTRHRPIEALEEVMRNHHSLARIIMRLVPVLVLVAALPLSGSVRASTPHANIIIGYLVKTLTNPYFVAMEPVAQAEAKKLGVTLVYEAGKYDGDSATQT